MELNTLLLTFSEEMIKLAQERKEKMMGKLNDIGHTFINSDAAGLSFIPEESVDVYMDPLALHLVPDHEKVLKEAMRVLKKGGRIGFSVKGVDEKNMSNALIDETWMTCGFGGPMIKGMITLDGREIWVKGFKVDYCWDQDGTIPIFDKGEARILINPKVAQMLSTKSKEDQDKFYEAFDRRFEKFINDYTPIKGNILFLVGRKPE